jgi:hypothetical protein
MYKKLLFNLIGFAIIILGCSSQLNSPIFIGKYCLNAPPFNDSLFLTEDSTYLHKFITSNGSLYQVRGKWKYNSNTDEILFRDFVFFNDSGTDKLPPGNWFSKVYISDEGEVRLVYSSEDNIWFIKK